MIVDTLLESQLFGHVRGAFTGATDTRPGLFEYANGGTVFLDEVGETLRRHTQAKLLRVIQNREIQRVGSPEVRHVRVRLIAATNRDLRAEVCGSRALSRGLALPPGHHIQIHVPSLIERLEDIPLLISFFLKKYNETYHKETRGLTHRAKALSDATPLVDNVREIENVIAGAVLLTSSDFIDVDVLQGHIQRPSSRGSAGEPWRPIPLDEVRSKHLPIQKVLEACGGNRVRAAQLLGIGRTSLYRHLKRESPSSVHAA